MSAPIIDIFLGYSMMYCSIITFSTMTNGLDRLYPKPYIPCMEDEYLKLKHSLPYIYTIVSGSIIFTNGVLKLLIRH